MIDFLFFFHEFLSDFLDCVGLKRLYCKALDQFDNDKVFRRCKIHNLSHNFKGSINFFLPMYPKMSF